MENIKEYYGLIERFERTDDNYQIVIDSIKQSAFDSYSKNPNIPIFEILLGNTSVVYATLSRKECQRLFSKFNPYRTELRWIRYSLSEDNSKTPVTEYDISLQLNESLFLESLELLDARKSEDKIVLNNLKKAFDIKNLEQEDISEITNKLKDIKNLQSTIVMVYNVGQGNANSVCSAIDNLPLLYFDLGGGSYQNKHTYNKIKKFCIEKKPLVFLSHWDFDHYSSAINSSELQSLKWVVPNQKIGAEAFKFASKLAANKNLFIWDKSSRLTNGGITLMKGLGKTKNDSGIILMIAFDLDGHKEKILLPGDCKYKHIPGIDKLKLTGLIASHHGGTYKGKKYIPVVTNGRLAISYGQNNTYHHPSDEMLTEYKKTGWNKVRETINGNIAFVRNSKIINKCNCKDSGINIQQRF